MGRETDYREMIRQAKGGRSQDTAFVDRALLEARRRDDVRALVEIFMQCGSRDVNACPREVFPLIELARRGGSPPFA